MSSFFTLPGSARKRKRSDKSGDQAATREKRTTTTGGKSKKPRRRDEEISSESEDGNVRARGEGEEEEDEDDELEGETAAEKRLRLAQQYLENVRKEVEDGGFDAGEIDRDLIAERLQGDVAEEKGRLYRYIADSYSLPSAFSTLFRTNKSITAGIAVCHPHFYTVTKDRHLSKWCLRTYPPPASTANITFSRKPKRLAYAKGGSPSDTSFNGHIGPILCLAASQDGKYVATGGADHRLVVWDAAGLSVLKVFKQHRAAVTGLVFRRNTNQLYSCSADRTVKLWSLDELAYVETLFGHQDEVVGIAALGSERCITVGARDRTARLWKIVDETQLVFRGGKGRAEYAEGSIDCIAMVDEELFVTGSDNGSICLWSVHKKKPVFTVPVAHGVDDPPPPGASSAEEQPPEQPPCPPQPRYITALAVLPYSDLVFSGSWDGAVRAWKVARDKKSLEHLGILGKEAVRGVVNSLAVFERDDQGTITVAAGTGTELRMGRWLKVKGRNGGYIIDVEKKIADKGLV